MDEPKNQPPARRRSCPEPTATRVYTPDEDAQLRALQAILKAARANAAGVTAPLGGGSK